METRKIVATATGWFSLSEMGYAWLQEKHGLTESQVLRLSRDDTRLLEVVETLEEKANALYCELAVLCVPADVKWQMAYGCNCEWVEEIHRVWDRPNAHRGGSSEIQGASRKIVINRGCGDFALSEEADEMLWHVEAIRPGEGAHRLPRDDYRLVEVVETLKERANGDRVSLVVVEVPADVEWELHSHDGIEWVAEKHRRWYPWISD